MSKTILYIATSLDGFIAGPNDDISWLDPYHDLDYGYNDFLSTVGAIILGRRTYDLVSSKTSAWPYQLPSFVVTHRPLEKSSPVTSQDSIQSALSSAQAATSQNIWLVGGSNLASQFLQAGLIDELVITILPVLLASGTPLFTSATPPKNLRLVQSITLNQGVVQLTYQPT